MSDDNLNLELGVQVTSQGTEHLTDLENTTARIKASFDRLSASAKKIKDNLSSLGKGGPDETKAAREALDIDKDRMRVLKMRMGYAARELRQQQQDELRGIREAERAQAQADRRALASARELTRERERGFRQIGRCAGQVRSGVAKTVAVGGAAAAAGTYATKRTVDTLTRSAVTIDDAITQAQIHVFGEQDASTSRKSAESLRKRLMPVASKLGTKTAELMGAYVEAAQAGISDDLLDTAVEQGTKYAKMNKLNVPDVLEQSGYAIQGLKSFGKFTADTLKSYFDETSYIIATTSANRQELLAATKTGMAAGAAVGMSRQETLAVLGSIVGVGGEGGQASRMLSTQGSRVADWRNKGRNIIQKHHRTAQDRQFLDAVNILRYRDNDAMADAFSKDFFGSLVNAQDKIRGISDPLKRKSITAQLFGKEFGALLDSVIMGGQLKEYRDKLKHASGFLNHNWDKFTANLGFILDKIGVVLGNLTDSLGIALKPLYQDLSQWIDRLPASFEGFTAAFRAGIDGFMRGLGSDDGSLGSLLNKVLGDPAQFRVDARAIFDFARGFGEGIRAVASSIVSVVRVFTGANADPERIGKWTGEFLTLSAALTAAAPAVIVMSSLAAATVGFGRAMIGAWSLIKSSGILGAEAAIAARTVAGAGSAAVGTGTAAGAGAAAAGAGITGAATAAGAAGAAVKPGLLSRGLGGLGLLGLAESAKELSGIGTGLADNAFGIEGKNALSFSGASRLLFKSGGPFGYLADWMTGGTGGVSGALGRGYDRLTGTDTQPHWQDVEPSKRLEEMRKALDKNTEAVRKNTEATQDDARKAADTKAAEIQAAEQKRLSELVAIRHPAMSGTVGSSGPSTADDLRSRGFLPITPNTIPNGQGRMPTANDGQGGRAVSGPGNGTMPRSSDAGSLTTLINREAARAGIDPRIMQGIRAGESGHRADYDVKSDRQEDSYGPYQLNRKGGLGARFERETGLDARDPKTIPAQTRWVAELIRKSGPGILRQWYGYHGPRDADPSWGNSGYVPNASAGEGGSVAGGLTTDGPVRANLMHGQYGQPGENLGRLVTGNGKSALVNNAALPAFQGFVRELEAQGYNIRSLGGFNNRMIRGGNRLSQHAYGNAIDLNPGNNPLGTSVTDMPGNVRALARKYGLIWGMDWKGRKDPMHFEWNGTKPWIEAQRSVEQTRSLADGINKPPAPVAAQPRDPMIKAQEAVRRTRVLGGTNAKPQTPIPANPQTPITDRPYATGRVQAEIGKTRSLTEGINRPPVALAKDKPDLSQLDVVPAPVADQFGTRLGEEAPIRGGGDRGLGASTPIRHGGRGGGGGINAPVNVHIGAIHGGGDPKAIGDEVGRRTREAMNTSLHDVDPGGFA